MNRETLLSDTFVTLADTMVKDFDVVDFLSMLSDRCLDLFDAGDAGLMLADGNGLMHLAASSSHEMRLLELLELQFDEGPCPDAYRAGFRAAHAVPMRLRSKTIGALNLLRVDPGALPESDVAAAQALADVATIGILHHRAAQEARLLSDQLQYALDSRIVVEQAKGVVSQMLDLDMDGAFTVLRSYSRDHNQRLVDTASAVIDRSLPAATLTAGGTATGHS